MPVVSFRPHTLNLLDRGKGGYDGRGDWAESPGGVLKSVPCRYEPNGRAGTVRLDDGTIYKYSYTVYLDVDPSLGIKYGDLVELVSQDGASVGRYEVKGFHRGQLDMKVWV